MYWKIWRRVANYKILIKPSAVKELNKVPQKELQKITQKINALATNPRPAGCEKLAAENAYRLRQGNYRIIYLIEDDKLIIVVIKVGHRKDVYRWVIAFFQTSSVLPSR